eukprot:gene6823-7354_t
MPKYALVEEAARHCWSKNFMEPFREFYARNADLFYDAPQSIAGEQNLQYYELYQQYLNLYEANLSSYIESLDVSIPEFYRELAAIRNDPEIKDKKLLHFVDYLVACTDYDSFYKVMTRAAKKLRQADERAESKTGGSDSKSSYGEAKSPSSKDYK